MESDETGPDPLEVLRNTPGPSSSWDSTGEDSFFSTSRGKLMAAVICAVSLAAVVPLVLIPLFSNSSSTRPAVNDPAVAALDAYVEFWRTGGGAPSPQVSALLDQAATETLEDGSTRVSVISSQTGLCWSVVVGGPSTPTPEVTDASTCDKG